MALFGKKNKPEQEQKEKKDGFFARFLKRDKESPVLEAEATRVPQAPEPIMPEHAAAVFAPPVAKMEPVQDRPIETVAPVAEAVVVDAPAEGAMKASVLAAPEPIMPEHAAAVLATPAPNIEPVQDRPIEPVSPVFAAPAEVAMEASVVAAPEPILAPPAAEIAPGQLETQAAEATEEPAKPGFFARFKSSASTPVAEVEESAEPVENKPGFFAKLKAGLKKTHDALVKGRLSKIFLATRKIDEELLEEIEEMLIGSDIGVQTTQTIIDTIRLEVKRSVLKNGDDLKEAIKAEMLRILREIPTTPMNLDHGPTVILIVGVNGVGKTTTIGKVANQFRKQGKSVVVCAADTFRAAAVEQLQVWAARAGVEIVLKEGSKDPAAVVFEALERVKLLKSDVLLIDTAGRLHNNPNLMNELDKIRRITTRVFPAAPHNVLLILDAVTGQNGLQQAKQFVAKVGVTDLILTKMDGTAKGGIAVAIAKELNLPIRFIGVGEQMDDLLPFSPEDFVNALFEG